MKHIEVGFHFVREKVATGDLQVRFISTHDQIIDIFTKLLPTPRFLLNGPSFRSFPVLSLWGRIRQLRLEKSYLLNSLLVNCLCHVRSRPTELFPWNLGHTHQRLSIPVIEEIRTGDSFSR
ncbi:hypothetical protein OSB04_001849 [Centaurea solstitialis]|uniref:Uncharacterized protein n=1 Tax=Centaurea solstitialis TaxID=347529 RepID=A0AA38UAI4_9ASTR|nr:hypothetical protein OSB04_001849 [Centaurea solstitialis]